MFNCKRCPEYEMHYSKTKNPDQVLKQQNEKVLLTTSPIQLMFIKCLLRERMKHGQDMDGHPKKSDVIPVLRERRHK